MIYMMRISIADNDFDGSTYLPVFQNVLFCILFVVSTVVMTVIFMNFIIAEVSNSYSVIKHTLHYKLLQERGFLINESEDILRSKFSTDKVIKWNHLFPKYIIKRELYK